MGSKLITIPAKEPVSLADMKAALRVEHSDDDALIGAYITAAREQIETLTSRALISQSWQLTIDSFAPTEIPIYKVPVISITSIKYTDLDGYEQTLDPSRYVLDEMNSPAWVVPTGNGWPATLAAINSVKIEFVAGYGTNETDVPAILRQAIRLQVLDWYDPMDAAGKNRKDNELAPGVMALINRHLNWF